MGCANGKSSYLDQQDLDYIATHTGVKKDEIKQKYQHFIQKHPDGKLSRAGFHEMVSLCYPNADTNNIEKHIFRMYDANDDGVIDFREFMIIMYIMSSGTPEDNLRQIFRMIDINNDGTITLHELKRIVKDLFCLVNEKNIDEKSQDLLAQTAFKEMDYDMDGKVTLEEFINACMSHKQVSTMLTLKIIEVFVA